MRRWIIAFAGVCLSASLLLARPGTVRTKDGQTVQGDIEEKAEQVVVKIRGIDTTIPRDNIESLAYDSPTEDPFKARWAKLTPTDVKGRVELARWAFDNRRYDQAREVLQEAIGIDPNSREATDMLETVQRQVRLEAAKRAQPAAPGATAAPGQPGAPRPDVERRFLSAADINRIRQVELKETDSNVRIRFENDVEKRFATTEGLSVSDFKAQKPIDRAAKILAKGDPGFSEDVKVLSDPTSIAEFKGAIQRKILAGCAATNCHGSAAGGKLVLYNPADTDPATYTNFYILQKYSRPVPDANKAVFGGGMRQMIDRTHPEQSLLVQYGLPVDVAEYDHPDVQGWRPIFRAANDPQYTQVINWIRASLVAVEPNYGIKFEVPAAPTSKPATQPAASPPASASAPAPAPARAPKNR